MYRIQFIINTFEMVLKLYLLNELIPKPVSTYTSLMFLFPTMYSVIFIPSYYIMIIEEIN